MRSRSNPLNQMTSCPNPESSGDPPRLSLKSLGSLDLHSIPSNQMFLHCCGQILYKSSLDGDH
ncbi:hypothetical protein A2U01_0040775 [Trifolium medium]|uniref:Uncharacterized protein n=1 Tax=Trifolium medium TaxID=97028 RepID=A0A392Q6V0_9FABA|nr:hypothetical protein [Trifolium medium]